MGRMLPTVHDPSWLPSVLLDRRPRPGIDPAEESPNTTGHGGGQQPPARCGSGTVPQRTDRLRATAGKGETVR